MTAKTRKSPEFKPDKPFGTITKVKNPKKHDYVMVRGVKYDGIFYKKGDRVRLTGKLLKLFISNNYIYG